MKTVGIGRGSGRFRSRMLENAVGLGRGNGRFRSRMPENVVGIGRGYLVSSRNRSRVNFPTCFFIRIF